MARVFALILVPSLVYLFVFYLHLWILNNTGPHDDLMTSAFQASLQVSSSHVSCIFVLFLRTLTGALQNPSIERINYHSCKVRKYQMKLSLSPF